MLSRSGCGTTYLLSASAVPQTQRQMRQRTRSIPATKSTSAPITGEPRKSSAKSKPLAGRANWKKTPQPTSRASE